MTTKSTEERIVFTSTDPKMIDGRYLQCPDCDSTDFSVARRAGHNSEGRPIWVTCKKCKWYGLVRYPCKRCGRMPTKGGHDACLGELPGVQFACCGHGIEHGYMVFDNDKKLYMFIDEEFTRLCVESQKQYEQSLKRDVAKMINNLQAKKFKESEGSND